MAVDSDMAPAEVSLIAQCGDLLGEGPLWDHRRGQLLWIDILRGIVHSWCRPGQVSELLRVDALIGSIALCGESDLLLATSKGLMLWRSESGTIDLWLNPIANKPVRFNDGRVDAHGRFWVGTMALDAKRYGEPLGELYRVDRSGQVKLMEQDLTISNGIDWWPDGRILYLTDTMRRAIYAYDFDANAGTISNRRALIDTAEGDGYPDGLVVDAGGGTVERSVRRSRHPPL
jgi:sugar lactone lactonase YvrE